MNFIMLTAAPQKQRQTPSQSKKSEGFFFQPKLTINQPNDIYEQEADAMADKVIRMSDPSTGNNLFLKPAISSIQRKCTHCEKDERKMQRKESNNEGTNATAPTEEYINSLSGGRSLSENERSFFEPRMAYTFNNVKVHTDDIAAISAQSINARAYTSGNNIVFNSDQYSPGTDSGKKLLGHELTHVTQQTGPQIKRQLIDVDIMVEDPAEVERLRQQQGIELPQVTTVVWSLLSAALITRMQKVLKQNGIAPANVPVNAVNNPVFVLHDTAIAMGARSISRAVGEARGPLGGGAAAYVPGTGSVSVARSGFFDSRRPTATEFEKGNDRLTLQVRLTNARAIWQNTNASARQTAMQNALAGLNLTPAEVSSETIAAKNQLNLPINSTDLVYSTGMWIVSEICSQITASGIQSIVNNASNTQVLQAAYDSMRLFFTTRNQRLASTVNIEIVQPSGGNCDPRGVALPAYTRAQYDNVSLLYLEAALQAGRFPQITTHFLVDKNAGTHCDPRCFNLAMLYQAISGLLTFPATSSFGITPQYGVGVSDNVWWSNMVCGGTHP